MMFRTIRSVVLFFAALTLGVAIVVVSAKPKQIGNLVSAKKTPESLTESKPLASPGVALSLTSKTSESEGGKVSSADSKEVRAQSYASNLQILEIKNYPPCHPNMFKRAIVGKAEFKYPYIRTEETIRLSEAGAESVSSRVSMVANHILVKLANMASEEDLRTFSLSLGHAIQSKLKAERFYLLSLGSMQADAIPTAIQKYVENRSLIQIAEPDYVVSNSSGLVGESKLQDCRVVGSGTVSSAIDGIAYANELGIAPPLNSWNIGTYSQALEEVKKTIHSQVASRGANGYSTDFNTVPADWSFDTPANGVGWAVDGTPSNFPSGISRTGSSLNFNNGVDYSGISKGGAMSPAISLAGLATPILKFWSNYQTETRGVSFDKRFVQILSADGSIKLAEWQLATVGYSFNANGGLVGVGPGPSGDAYIDIETGTPVAAWHRHKIFLDPAWQTIRVRFFFDSVDDKRNGYAGWAIDDLSVESSTTSAPTGWPDLFPDTTTPSGFNTTVRSGNTLSWSWASANQGSPGVHMIVGNNPNAQLDESFLFYHDAHGHYHMSQFADFSLWEQRTGVGFVKVLRSPKRSYCLTDVEPYVSGSPSISPGCGGQWQTISYNWKDVYSRGTAGQDIDVSNLTVGAQYYLVGVTDPLNRIRELNNTNNMDYIRFNLPSTGAVTNSTRAIPFPPNATALSISSATVGTFQGVPAINLIGTGFDPSLVPVVFDVGTAVAEAPFFTIVSPTEIWVNIPATITYPASIDLLRSRGDSTSARIATGPYVAYRTATIDDDSINGTSGNGNGVVNPGELIGLTVKIANLGSGSTSGVKAVLSLASPDAGISIMSNTVNYGSLAPEAESLGMGIFKLQVSPSIATPHPINLVLSITDDASRTWTHTLSLMVYSSGLITGKVTRGRTGAPIAGATVTYSGPLNGTVTTAADGRYAIQTINGTYTLKATASGVLASDTVNRTVPPDTEQDFVLGVPDIDPTLASLTASAAPGESITRNLALNNLGDYKLVYKVLPNSYQFKDSDSGSGVAYVWNDIAATGTVITGLADDTTVGPFPIGFSFPFYQANVNQVRVCSNGWLSFGSTASTVYTNSTLPNAGAPDSMVAFCWDDLNFSSSGVAHYKKVDANTFVIQFTDVAFYANTINKLTCQVHLKSDGSILFYYKRMDLSNSCSVGIQNATKDSGLTVAFNAPYLHSDMAIRISNEYGAPWLSTSPTNGTVAADASQNVELRLNAGQLAAGTYTAKLGIESNDPDESLVIIPVKFNVSAAGNSAPFANPQTISTAEDTPVSLTLSGGDPLGDTIIGYTINSYPSHGTLSGIAPNLKYTPAANFNGTDSFKFKVNDGSLQSAEATIALNITEVNDAPEFISDLAVTPNPGVVGQLLQFSAGANDVDNDVLSYLWDFGDGTTAAGGGTSHAYNLPGLYRVGVRITDGKGEEISNTVLVTILTPATPPNGLRINFLPQSSLSPQGYLSDTGAVFADRGNGYSYGWNLNNSTTARDRNAANSPDQRFDTLQHMQKPENPNAKWEIAVPNGNYSVRIVCGDPSYFDSTYKIDVENVLTVNGAPSASRKWIEGSQSITVRDGRLSVSNATGGKNNKICFIEINSVEGRSIQNDLPDAEPLVVLQLQTSMKFKKSGRDAYRLKGSLPTLVEGFKPLGTNASIDVGAAIASFTLDAKGRARTKSGTIQMKFIPGKGWWFTGSVRGGSWKEEWGDGGLSNENDKKRIIELPVTLTLGGQAYGGSKSVEYSAKQDASGVAK